MDNIYGESENPSEIFSVKLVNLSLGVSLIPIWQFPLSSVIFRIFSFPGPVLCICLP